VPFEPVARYSFPFHSLHNIHDINSQLKELLCGYNEMLPLAHVNVLFHKLLLSVIPTLQPLKLCYFNNFITHTEAFFLLAVSYAQVIVNGK
jgi:hypothetical protein